MSDNTVRTSLPGCRKQPDYDIIKFGRKLYFLFKLFCYLGHAKIFLFFSLTTYKLA